MNEKKVCPECGEVHSDKEAKHVPGDIMPTLSEEEAERVKTFMDALCSPDTEHPRAYVIVFKVLGGIEIISNVPADAQAHLARKLVDAVIGNKAETFVQQIMDQIQAAHSTKN